MNITETIQQIFELCIVPLLIIGTKYLVSLIQKKKEEIDSKMNNEELSKYSDMLANTIEECVIATNQTYVDSLKNKNAFDKKAQKEAFNLTYEKVKALLTDEAQKMLEEAYGDLNLYITTKIEAEVNMYKAAPAQKEVINETEQKQIQS